MNNEGVDILDVDDDNDFKDTGKWKDRSRAWFEKIKSNELIPQLAFEVNEQYELVLILETILKKDKYEHEMDSFETLGRKYLWFKDINELNLLFCLCNEQLCDEDTKNKLMLWTDIDLVKDEKGLNFWFYQKVKLWWIIIFTYCLLKTCWRSRLTSD